MKFLEPGMLWNLLWVLPLMTGLFAIAWYRRERAVRTLTASGYVSSLSRTKRVIRFLFLLGAAFLLITALARPSWDYQIQDLKGSGRDILVVLDVSKSMLCQDIQPSRLEHAKWLIREIVKRNPGDRFGLILFAGRAFLECPLTIDGNSFLQTLQDADVRSIPVGGTNIQEALEAALRAFDGSESVNRAILLVSDGDELYGRSSKALEEVKKRRIPVFIAGIGDPSQAAIIQVKEPDGTLRTVKDAQGNVVNARLNEKQMVALAAGTGGIYVRSTAADPGIGSLEKRIRKLDSKEYEVFQAVKPVERFQWPLGGAFLLFLLWLVMGERKHIAGKSLGLLLLCAVSLNLSAQTPAAAPAAPEKTAKDQPVKTETPEAAYNRLLTLQKQGDTAAAGKGYQELLAKGGLERSLEGRILQNSGVIVHGTGRGTFGEAVKLLNAQKLDESLKKCDETLKNYEGAEELYREAMRKAPDTPALSADQTVLLQDREAAEKLKKKIEELKKQQQKTRDQTKQAKQEQQKQNQQKQDQQKQDQQKQEQQKQNQQKQNQQKQNQQKQNQQKQNQQKQNQQKQDQQNLQNRTQQAAQSAEKLEQQAKELNQKNLQEQAGKAKEELRKAREEQKKGSGKKAEQHIDQALKALGEDSPRQDQKQDQKQNGKKKPENGREQPKPAPQPKQGEKKQAPAPKPGEKGKMDPAQAAALLEMMAKDGKDLREELKRQKNSGIAPVEKDW